MTDEQLNNNGKSGMIFDRTCPARRRTDVLLLHITNKTQLPPFRDRLVLSTVLLLFYHGDNER